MALFHLHVTQVKRSAGQSVVTSAAYRAGEKLYSEYYGEVSDYTHKGGVVCTDILLPPQAPNQYQDRATLWNAVEKAERGKKAQLAYSFDIALQNEFSLEENIALARQFVSEQLVGRGMIADFAIHQPDKEDGGIPNPHFHVLCPIRPIEPDGKWGCKQRRRYRLDEDGNRIMGEDGKPLFDAVPTTDWGSPETLEHWREAWAAMVNAKFEEKGLTCRIDHRSYERQGLDLLPTVHEGVAVRQMEAKGIPTDKGDLNRWIKKANPFAYIHSEKDILKLVTTLISNTKGEQKGGDAFWEKAETLLYCALIGFIHYEAPVEEQNFATLIEFINAMEVREDDEEFKNPVDLMFEELAEREPNHFAVRQYAKYRLAAGKTAKSMAGGGIILLGTTLIPLLSGLFG